MSGHKPWSEISAKVRADPERRARIEQREQAIEAGLTISQLREALGATQESVAERMKVTQSNVSHFEHNPNIFLRSLADYVEALGGQLEIRWLLEPFHTASKITPPIGPPARSVPGNQSDVPSAGESP
jgi:hypothetical protein